MLKGERFKLTLNNLKLFTLITALFWSMILATSIWLDIGREDREIDAYAKILAQIMFEKDALIHRWHSHNGGMYAPVSENNQVNPYLAHLQERDIVTASGDTITLNNPVHMTRQIFEAQDNKLGLQWHFTGRNLKPSGNNPDRWELQAMRLFEKDKGVEEYGSLEEIEGTTYYRYMQPLRVDEGCLKCHTDEGLKPGDIFGGTSLAIPLDDITQQAETGQLSYLLQHLVLWLLGLAGIVAGYRLFSGKLRERINFETVLHKQAAFVQNNPAPVFQTDIEGHITFINAAGLKLLMGDFPGEPISAIVPLLTGKKLNQIRTVGLEHLEQAIGAKIYLFAVSYEESTHSFYIYGNDITEQREMEISRRENFQFLETLLETVPSPMFFKDITGFYRGCNKAFAENIMGQSKEQIIGKSVYDFPDQISSELADKYSNADLYLFNNPGTQEYEAEVKCSDGKTRHFLFNKATYNNIGGEVVGIVGIMHDLSQIRRVEKALRASEIKFRSIFDNAQVGLFRVALPDGKLLECNDKFSQIIGYVTIEDCLSQFRISEHCLDPDTCRNMLEDSVRKGEIKNYETQIKGVDGINKWLRYSVKYFAEDNYLQGVVADITPEKMAFDLIRQSNQKVISILASISDGFYTLDQLLNITYFNLAAERILDRRGEEVLGKNLFEIFPHFKNTIIYSEYLRALDERKPRAFEVSFYNKGQEEWYDIRVYPNEEGISVYFQEITERKQFEQILVDKEYRLRSIFNAAADGFVVINQQGWIDSINPAALKIFGYDSEFQKRKNITELIPNFMESCFRILEDSYIGSELIVQSGEFEGLRRDDGAVPVKASISELNLHSQQYYTVVIYDLTAERENMRRLIEIDKFSSIGTLAAGVAHEFKNYLAGIIGNASFALENMSAENPDLTRETLEQIMEIGESANKTAMSLLTYSHKNPQLKSREHVNTLINNAIKLVHKEALISEIEIATHLGDLPRILLSPANVQQMILNILLNALQAIGTRGKVEIGSELVEGDIVIRISDNGCGIPGDKIGKIFDPFYSTKGVWGKDKVSGSGLGLSISRNIAVEHNGSIEVESKVGEGTTFTIRLQVVECENADLVLQEKLDKSNCVLFSLNADFISDFKSFSEYKGRPGQIYNSFAVLQKLEEKSILLIIDAQYPGLGELYRAADFCEQNGIDYILINTGDVPEMQLQGLIDDALTFYAGWPEILQSSPADSTTVACK